MKVYRYGSFVYIRMALLVVLLLFTASAMESPGLNSCVGLPTPVSAQDCGGWGGGWNGWGGVYISCQANNYLDGSYTYGAHHTASTWTSPFPIGAFKGTFSGNQFTGTWGEEPDRRGLDTSGEIELMLASDGKSITGRYRTLRAAREGAGQWIVLAPSWTRINDGTGTGTDTGTVAPGATWSGPWKGGDWDEQGTKKANYYGDLVLTQNGNRVTGYWTNITIKDLSGTVTGNQFTGKWRGNLASDQSVLLTLAPDGQSLNLRFNSGSGQSEYWTSCTCTRINATTGTGAALIAESRTADPGSTVQVPVRLDRAANVGSMNFMLTYNAQVIKVNKVDGGSLVSGALFTPNFRTSPQVRFGLASSDGISGSGSVAYIEFQVIGAAGSSSPLTLSEVDTTDTTGKSVTVTTQNGTVTVASATGAGDMPDWDGDGKVTELDALAALKMSVKLLEEKLKLDVDKNGKVTAEDARLILKMAVGK